MKQSREDSIAQDIHGNVQSLPFTERERLVRIITTLPDKDVEFLLSLIVDWEENYHPELDHCYETVRSSR